MKTVLGVFQNNIDAETADVKFTAEGFKPMKLSRDDAADYNVQLEEGAFLLAIPTRENQLDLVMMIFDDCNASDMKTISEVDSDLIPGSQRMQSDQRQYAHAHTGEKGGKTKKATKRAKKK